MRLLPPSMRESRAPSGASCSSTRFRILIALPRPLSISRPEWPPRRPPTLISRPTVPAGAASRLDRPCAHRVAPARTPDVQGAFFLGVEVQQRLALEEPGLQAVRAGEAGFLVDREEELERAVDQRLVGHDGQARRDGHAVVGAERGAVGHHRVALAHQRDRVLQEVVLLVGPLLGHHVEVALQAHHRTLRRTPSTPASARPPCRPCPGRPRAPASWPCRPRSRHGGFVFRGTGDLRNLGEVLPQSGGFQSVNRIRHVGGSFARRGSLTVAQRQQGLGTGRWGLVGRGDHRVGGSTARRGGELAPSAEPLAPTIASVHDHFS